MNFFVLALERLGAKVNNASEGNPHGFFIWFSCDEDLARRISAAGHFSIEIMKAGWRMSIQRAEVMTPTETGEPWNEESKAQSLRWASEAWAKSLNLKPFWE